MLLMPPTINNIYKNHIPSCYTCGAGPRENPSSLFLTRAGLHLFVPVHLHEERYRRAREIWDFSLVQIVLGVVLIVSPSIYFR